MLDRGQHIQCLRSMCGLEFDFLVFEFGVTRRFFLILLVILILVIILVVLFIFDVVGLEFLFLVFVSLSLSFRIRRLVVSFASVYDGLCIFILLGYFFVGLVVLHFQIIVLFCVVNIFHIRVHIHFLGITVDSFDSRFIRGVVQRSIDVQVNGQFFGVWWPYRWFDKSPPIIRRLLRSWRCASSRSPTSVSGLRFSEFRFSEFFVSRVVG